MEDAWLTYAKRLQSIAATGLHYSDGAFDIDRYREIERIALQMIADLGDRPIGALTGLPHPSEGYATPKVDVRGAVLRDGKILLVQERADALWTLPGGFAEIGLTASENVTKEVAEEAGLHVRCTKLFALRHRARMPGQPDYRDFYKLFYLCAVTDPADPRPGPETTGAAFFDPEGLPPMSLGRSGPEDVQRALYHWHHPEAPADWD